MVEVSINPFGCVTVSCLLVVGDECFLALFAFSVVIFSVVVLSVVVFSVVIFSVVVFSVVVFSVLLRPSVFL